MRPCSTCPWTTTAPLGFWAPHHLISISYAMSGDLPLGSMGCHKFDGSTAAKALQNSPPCGGWIRVARESVMVRLLIACGKITPDELTSNLENLFPDVETMLRWNGIDVDRLPPLKCPRFRSATEHAKWMQSVVDLQAKLNANPESARDYVLPGSPMAFGVDDDAIPLMPKAKLNAWLKKCRKPVVCGTPR